MTTSSLAIVALAAALGLVRRIEARHALASLGVEHVWPDTMPQ